MLGYRYHGLIEDSLGRGALRAPRGSPLGAPGRGPQGPGRAPGALGAPPGPLWAGGPPGPDRALGCPKAAVITQSRPLKATRPIRTDFRSMGEFLGGNRANLPLSTRFRDSLF